MNIEHKDDLKSFLESITEELITSANVVFASLKGKVSALDLNKFTVEKSDITLSKNFSDLFVGGSLSDSKIKIILGYLSVAHCIDSIAETSQNIYYQNQSVKIIKVCELILNYMCKTPIYTEKKSTKESYLNSLSLKNQCIVLLRDLYQPLKSIAYKVVKKEYIPNFNVSYIKSSKQRIEIIKTEKTNIPEIIHFEILADQLFGEYNALDMAGKLHSDLYVNTDRNYKLVIQKGVFVVFNRTHDLYSHIPDFNDRCIVKDGKQYRVATMLSTCNEVLFVFRLVSSEPPKINPRN